MVVKDTEKLRASALRSPLQIQSVPLKCTGRGKIYELNNTKGGKARRRGRGRNRGMSETEEISGEKISSRGWRSEESLELSVRAERPKNIEQRLEERGER